MKKLNKKGYLTVEIILAASIAFVIAAFLIDLTVKLSNKTDDAYLNTVLITDKALIIDNVMTDIKEKKLVNVTEEEYNSVPSIHFSYADGEEKQLYLNENNKKLIYGDYQKEFEVPFSDVSFSVNEYTIEETEYFNIRMTLKNIYSDNDYGFNITVPKANTEQIGNMITLRWTEDEITYFMEQKVITTGEYLEVAVPSGWEGAVINDIRCEQDTSAGTDGNIVFFYEGTSGDICTAWIVK